MCRPLRMANATKSSYRGSTPNAKTACTRRCHVKVIITELIVIWSRCNGFILWRLTITMSTKMPLIIFTTKAPCAAIHNLLAACNGEPASRTRVTRTASIRQWESLSNRTRTAMASIITAMPATKKDVIAAGHWEGITACGTSCTTRRLHLMMEPKLL